MSSLQIWVRHPEKEWLPAQVKTRFPGGDGFTVVFEDGVKLSLSGAPEDYELARMSMTNPNVIDLGEIMNVTESVAFTVLRGRFRSNRYFTYAGNELIYLNPRKHVNMFNAENHREAKSSNKPHIFATAEKAFSHMEHEGKDQFVIITGSSGSGKTAMNKYLHDYLARRVNPVVPQELRPKGPALAARMDTVASLLNAFGCRASTVSACTSSHVILTSTIMDLDLQMALGASVDCIFLAQDKVHSHEPGSTNFNIFYQLVEGLDSAAREPLRLGNMKVDDFNILQPHQSLREPRKDASALKPVLLALYDIGLTNEDVDDVLNCLMAILLLGNLEFREATDKTAEVVIEVTDVDMLDRIAGHLRMRTSVLIGFLYRTESGRKVSSKVPIPLSQAQARLHTFMGFLYDRLYGYLLFHINKYLAPDESEALRTGRITSIDMCMIQSNSLDGGANDEPVAGIAGLMSNYCHERLQLHVHDAFVMEASLLKSGGVDAEAVVEPNKKSFSACVELFEDKDVGILANVSKQASLENGLSENFSGSVAASSLAVRLGMATSRIASGIFRTTEEGKHGPSFTVAHTFGESIQYKVSGYVEEYLYHPACVNVLEALCSASESSVLKTKVSLSNRDFMGLPERFGKVLKDLSSEDNHQQAFVRCLRPNASLDSTAFEPKEVLAQFNGWGVMEDLRLQVNSYHLRLPLMRFKNRFKALVAWYRCFSPIWGSMPKQTIFGDNNNLVMFLKDLLRHFLDQRVWGGNKDLSHWSVGDTTVLVREMRAVDVLRNEELDKRTVLGVRLQAIVRGFITRCRPATINPCRTMIQKTWRDREDMMAEDRLARSVEDLWKQDPERAKDLDDGRIRNERRRLYAIECQKHEVASQVQALVRGKLARNWFLLFRAEKLLERAMLAHNEIGLEFAIMVIDALERPPDHIKAKSTRAKGVLTSLQKNNYIENQLQVGIRSENIALLRDACRLAEGSNMDPNPTFHEAVQLLHVLQSRRNILGLLRQELELSSTVPQLVGRADRILEYLEKVQEYGIGEESKEENSIVVEGYTRLQRVERLIVKRNEMRAAVESCDFVAMNALMEEQAKVARMYGAGIFGEEMRAMTRMNEMHQREVAIGAMTHHDDAVGEISKYERKLFGRAWGSSSAHLPLFMFSLLDKIHRSRDVDEVAFDTAQRRLELVTSDPERRNHFHRLFKWVVAFATWKYREHHLLSS